MALINYDVSTTPADPEVTIQLALTADSVGATISSLNGATVSVSPSTGTIVAGAVAGSIVGLFGGVAGALLGGGTGVAAVYAVGDLLQSGINSALGSDVVGQGFTQKFDNNIGYSYVVEGVTITVTAATLSLSTSNGMLMASGTVTVS